MLARASSPKVRLSREVATNFLCDQTVRFSLASGGRRREGARWKLHSVGQMNQGLVSKRQESEES